MRRIGNTYDLTESQLIDGCIRGDRRAQRQLYDLYAKRMTALCMRYCGDYEVALDLMHDGFIKLFTRIESYSGQGVFEAWMRKIFVNTSLEYLRKNDALRESSDIEDVQIMAQEPSTIEQLSADEIMRLIQELPVGFRTVFNLYAIEGYSHAEIANLLQINESSSRSQFSRARAILRTKIIDLYK
ncbi:MAG TPA: RNA polymerase sigma factor [Paludibacteraceae bacterium]|jgi:RNA polymerase sigma-70 factor (ECF subfamily)|nr:RNA polymerase sigma factor [Paludibacteraceae bacterium]